MLLVERGAETRIRVSNGNLSSLLVHVLLHVVLSNVLPFHHRLVWTCS